MLIYSHGYKKRFHSTIPYEFMALSFTGEKAKWLRNISEEVPIWNKAESTIIVWYENHAAMLRVYSEIFNGKYVKRLISNGTVALEYVQVQRKFGRFPNQGPWKRPTFRTCLVLVGAGMNISYFIKNYLF